MKAEAPGEKAGMGTSFLLEGLKSRSRLRFLFLWPFASSRCFNVESSWWAWMPLGSRQPRGKTIRPQCASSYTWGL